MIGRNSVSRTRLFAGNIIVKVWIFNSSVISDISTRSPMKIIQKKCKVKKKTIEIAILSTTKNCKYTAMLKESD
jgi:hypothetical protein